ncbi:ATP-binding protein [Acidimicrobiia bacterium EGI L10123]|uniref:ATP-binding protein n=1 Tax=Salinilacustrithrix flava TaxID=2957203 RepID=UPI003D7C29CF|nr:ATP-binding protein [Acidimicrobiia bacterium EGI L10123]
MRSRLLLSTVGIAVLVALLLGIPMGALLDRLAYETARSQAERQAVSVGLALEPALVSGRVPTPALLEAIVGEQERLTLVTSSGRTITGGGVEGTAYTVTAPGPVGTQIQLTISDDDVRREIRRSWAALASLAIFGIAAAVVLALVQSRRLGRPLLRLQRQAERIGAGDFTAAAPRAGLPEIDAIAVALDDTATRIAGLVKAERSFSANASHQLRSALTGLLLRLEHLSEHEDPEVRDEARAALGQGDRLLTTVEELLLLARTGRAGEQRPVDLRTLAGEHVEDWRDRFSAADRRIELAGDRGVVALVSPGGMGQVLDVLLDNAHHHGTGTVLVHVARAGDHAEIIVRDEGRGIEGETEIFARRVDGRGHGLGLALARTLAEADGGTLDLVRRDPTSFRVRVPIDTSSPGDVGKNRP